MGVLNHRPVKQDPEVNPSQKHFTSDAIRLEVARVALRSGIPHRADTANIFCMAYHESMIRLLRAIGGLRRIVLHPLETIRWAGLLNLGVGGNLGHEFFRTQPEKMTLDMTLALMALSGVREAMYERDGTVWRSDFGDEIGRSLFHTGGYETDELSALIPWIKDRTPSGYIIDVGANIGTTSLPFAQNGYKVIAIEPVPATFEMLSENVVRNGLTEAVICVRQAIAIQEGVLDLWTGTGSGQAEVVVDGTHPAMLRWGGRGDRISAPSAPLSTILGKLNVRSDEVAMVWADVQGGETSVIETGKDLWSVGVPLYCEVDATSLSLHGGVEHFIECASQSFTSFVVRDDLVLGNVSGRPIASLAVWVRSISRETYSDVLLLP